MASFLPHKGAILALLALPVLAVADRVIETEYLSRSEAVLNEVKLDAEDTVVVTEKCEEKLSSLFDEKGTSLDNVVFSIHHNGNAEPCGNTAFDLQAFHSALATMDSCQDMNKYQLESFLTRFFAKMLQDNECSSDNNHGDGFLSYCDMGHDRTPILLDHNELVRLPETDSLPCRFHTREGVRIQSFEQLADLARNAQKCSSDEETCQDRTELHLYAVSAGRVFMFAPHHVGEVFELPHVETLSGLPVSLEVLSLSPRVFEIYNFFRCVV